MIFCPHCHGAVEAPASSPQAPADVKALRGKSTETEAQKQRIVSALRTGPKTTDDLRRLGIYQVSARVFGLRADGYVIETELFDGYSADGYRHARMARYTLKEEPLPVGGRGAQESPGTGAGARNSGEAVCN